MQAMGTGSAISDADKAGISSSRYKTSALRSKPCVAHCLGGLGMPGCLHMPSCRPYCPTCSIWLVTRYPLAEPTMMRPLTISDVAFLLCTSLQRPPPCSLTFTTDLGLSLTLHPDGSVSAALQLQHQLRYPEQSPAAKSQSQSIIFTRATLLPSENTGIDAILLRPLLQRPPNDTYRGLVLQKEAGLNLKPLRYRISPPGSDMCHNMHSITYDGRGYGECTQYIHYTTTTSPITSSSTHLKPEDLPARYSPAWCDAFSKWVSWAERSRTRRRTRTWVRGGGQKAPGSGGDEGERMLWMAEGLLLACWLCLQPGVDVVEYVPGLMMMARVQDTAADVGKAERDGERVQPEVYILEKGRLGVVVGRFVRDLARGSSGLNSIVG
ncbi:hypothetical protein N656DRAFT_464736 [Canariomyces notabilis]|uniref:Uncharacterized protein n=1 Tax=Canariomyces notabilis TaxID=2074819 RepID=A0AAN6QFE1_9PEZI|nr:hypothetical protein N656DRAFT_464736 [Canariomyces arenarius]